MKTIADMTTAEMVVEYNSLTGKSIKKFSSRAAGEKQLEKARAEHVVRAEETEDKNDNKPRAVNKEKLSEAIAKSWENPETHLKRSRRDSVMVEGKGHFNSVRDAFNKLNLPLEKHIKFRMELKVSRSAEFGGYKFSIVEQGKLV